MNIERNRLRVEITVIM